MNSVRERERRRKKKGKTRFLQTVQLGSVFELNEGC